ncbi:probable RNA-binding protein 18 [Onthophagus taurus]|uniref:probable RNA-binding protein 18 n=1 Tax=Onthophagus taurus TaxID=166361 RepID=UPI000C1FE7BC|nr:probable RNA-binding protein 18 [Onthophagus taurus]
MTTKQEEKVVTSSQDDKRLWIGNLDQRISEYQLLKLLQKHGEIEKFDLLFHRSGPLAGQPRGYAFVTYVNKSDAQTAITNLHNVAVGLKKIIVTWANSVNTDDMDKPKVDLNIPALAMSKPEKKTDRQTQIQAIEAKLKLMEHSQNSELVINKTVATESPVISQFQQNKQQPITTSSNNIKYKNNFKRHERNHKPYNRHKTKR